MDAASAAASSSLKYPGLSSRSVYKRYNLDLKPYPSKQSYSSFGLASGDKRQPSSPYSSRWGWFNSNDSYEAYWKTIFIVFAIGRMVLHLMYDIVWDFIRLTKW